MRTSARGFTLVELMIVLVIVAILAAITIPGYTRYVRKGRRSDAQSSLLQKQACFERCFSQNSRYTGCDTTCIVPGASQQGYYNITVTGLTDVAYTLVATATGAQASDAECTALTIDQQAVKGRTGTATVAVCWAS